MTDFKNYMDLNKDSMSAIRKILSFPNVVLNQTTSEDVCNDPLTNAINRLAASIENYNRIQILKDFDLLTAFGNIEKAI